MKTVERLSLRCPMICILLLMNVLMQGVSAGENEPDARRKVTATTPRGDRTVFFRKSQLDNKFRSEGVAVGDFNRDGRRDIAAGNVWFEAPKWTVHRVRKNPVEFKPKGYSDSFCNFAHDVNQDGWDDLIVVDTPGQGTWWYENPRRSGVPWKRHMCVPVTNNESPTLIDLKGDGGRVLVYAIEKDRRMAIARPTGQHDQPWKQLPISAIGAPGTERYSHGLGIGDVNADGRLDILIRQGWWKSPSTPQSGEWEFHPASLGDDCAQMVVFDFDGDGDNDVASSSSHNYGVWWHEQLTTGKFRTRLIDDRYSQTHALALADINGDGLPDLVTGKRWWAHGGNDPGGNEPAVMFWYELSIQDNAPHWVPHQFDDDSGIGTQFEVADVNGDGHLDVVTANKKGVFYFEQYRR